MVLPNPARPATTIPETSASRTVTGELSSAQPNHQESKEAGSMPDRSIRAGASIVKPSQAGHEGSRIESHHGLHS
jgi:hypothetical protein